MEFKEINFRIPKYSILPDDINKFTEQENLLMLLIGINTVLIVKKEYIDNDLCNEIEERIKNTYQKIIDDREHQNKELNNINNALKKSFEETSMKTLNNYYEKIQDGISRETKNISLLYEKQLECQRNEIQKYQEKLEILNRELNEIKIAADRELNEVKIATDRQVNEVKINTERKIIDEINFNKKIIENENILQINYKENEIHEYQDKINNLNSELMQMKIDMSKQLEIEISKRLEYKENIIEKQSNNLREFQERITELEKTVIKLEDLRIYSEKDNSNKLELEIQKLIIQKETQYNSIVDKYKITIDELKEKINKNEMNYKSIENEKNQELIEKCKILQEELLQIKTEYNEYNLTIEKERNEKLNNVIQKNEYLLEESKNAIEELKKEKNMSNTLKGDVGENYLFELLIDTFNDFENFNIENKSKISHSADILLEFNNFSILIDSKNYTNGVGKKEIKKLNDDINNNKHIKIAWLVSLQTPINGFSKYPVMYDIKDNVCYCYINSLCKHDNPKYFLRTIWYTCSFLFERILNVDTGELLLEKYKKNENRIKNIVDKMLKKSKERIATLKQLTDNFDETERDLKEILSDEIVSVYELHSEIVKNWWNNNIKFQENSKLKTKDIHEIFINNENNKNSGINIDSFKYIIKDIVKPPASIITGKTNKADYVILNVSF
jgi:hypothetical protein